jgi:hypothetical protein
LVNGRKKIVWALFIVFLSAVNLEAQLWKPDTGDERYKNPVIYADYSDPDVIRVGEDFYMVASSFNCMPGIPVLHSNDLVNWEIINYVYQRLPLEKYNKPQHGSGAWAPLSGIMMAGIMFISALLMTGCSQQWQKILQKSGHSGKS